MQDIIKKYIFEGNYNLAVEYFEKNNLSLLDIQNMLFSLAYDTESICIYSFVCYMITKSNDITWIKFAVNIMIHPLCYIEGAYSIALYHSREILKKEYNEENLEMLLFFYDIPEKLISKSEAEEIARKIIEIEPNNIIALEIIEN